MDKMNPVASLQICQNVHQNSMVILGCGSTKFPGNEMAEQKIKKVEGKLTLQYCSNSISDIID